MLNNHPMQRNIIKKIRTYPLLSVLVSLFFCQSIYSKNVRLGLKPHYVQLTRSNTGGNSYNSLLPMQCFIIIFLKNHLHITV